MYIDLSEVDPVSLGLVVVAVVAMYAVLLALARWAGVRSFAEMSTFDVAVVIAIGSTIATTVVGEHPPVLRGVVTLTCLYVLQLSVSWLRRRFGVMQRIVDNQPILLMGPGGQLLHRNMSVARVTEDDLRSKLRKANVHDLREVRAVIMEGTGDVNVLFGGCTSDRIDPWLIHGVRNYEHDSDLMV